MLIKQHKNAMLREYTRAVNRDLAQQNPFDLMQRNVLQSMLDLYPEVIKLFELGKANGAVSVDPSMLGQMKTICDGFLDEFLPAVIKHHRSSCALSNFPQEHNPSPEYIAKVLNAVDRQWQNHSVELTKKYEITDTDLSHEVTA
jgi:monoamine oxidase